MFLASSVITDRNMQAETEITLLKQEKSRLQAQVSYFLQLGSTFK